MLYLFAHVSLETVCCDGLLGMGVQLVVYLLERPFEDVQPYKRHVNGNLASWIDNYGV